MKHKGHLIKILMSQTSSLVLRLFKQHFESKRLFTMAMRSCTLLFFFFFLLLYFIDVYFCTTLFVMGQIKCVLRTQLSNNNSLGRIDVNVCAAQILGTTFAFYECLNVVAVLSTSTHSHFHFASVVFF